jgi:hypothetical protein
MVRLLSLLLYLASILIAWGVMTEVTPTGSPLRLLLPATMALLPSYADLMTSMNNDTAAIIAFSLFLWGGVRLIRRGFSILDFLWTVSAAILCYWTKNSVYLALPLLGVVLLFAILRKGLWRKLAWGSLGVAIPLSAFIVFDWGDAALWESRRLQTSPIREVSSVAPFGQSVFRMEIPAGESLGQYELRQIIPRQTVRNLEGKTLTLGVWIWASQPVKARLPLLIEPYQQNYPFQEVQLGLEPTFYAVSSVMPITRNRTWVTLSPLTKAPSGITVWYDGLVLAEGERPLTEPPQFATSTANEGVWGGKPFVNLLRNASAEASWPRVRPWADEFGSKIFPDRGRPALMLYTLLDQSAAGWYYRETGENLLRTFWAMFGWGHVPLWGYAPYRPLGAITLLGLLGAAIPLWKKRKTLPWDALAFFALTMLGVWGLAWLRGSIYIFYKSFIPGARYVYAAIIPTLLVLIAGWSALGEQVGRRWKLFQRGQILIYLSFYVVLDIYSWVSIIHYYYG